jgi:DNA invertase Pin-like site-specific DNA recombinase
MVGYIRVSSVDQHTERQLDGITLDKVFTDKASGKDTDRPELKAALAYLREGDTLTVHSMDRLARNCEDMLRTVRELNGKGVSVRFVKENMSFVAGSSDPRSTLMFTMLSAFSEFERALIRERQREGIAIAKAQGKYKGGTKSLTAEQVKAIKEKVTAGVPKTKIAKQLKISRQTLYNYLQEGNSRVSTEEKVAA